MNWFWGIAFILIGLLLDFFNVVSGYLSSRSDRHVSGILLITAVFYFIGVGIINCSSSNKIISGILMIMFHFFSLSSHNF